MPRFTLCATASTVFRMQRMKILFTIWVGFTFGQLSGQSVDSYVTSIEKQRRAGVLIEKASADKTVVGSLTAFYDGDSLVLINSLMDGEASGVESLYYIKDGALKKVFIMTAHLGTNDKWKGYHSRHEAQENCYTCHGIPECFVAEITYGDKTVIRRTENGRAKLLTEDDQDRMVSDIQKTFEELKSLVKDLN